MRWKINKHHHDLWIELDDELFSTHDIELKRDFIRNHEMIIIESEFFYYNLFIQTLLKLLEIKLKKENKH